MSRLCLNDTWGPCPPDGYRYVFPDDGYLVHAWTYVDWVAAAKSHLQANGKDIPLDLEALMQEQLCLTLPPGWCNYDDPDRPRPLISLSWNDVASGLKAFARLVADGCSYVSQQEADRRALICSRCYLNVNVQGCAGCAQAVVDVVGSRKTKYDLSLRSCAVCRCFLRAKVHFPQRILDKESPGVQEMYPGFCWLNKKGDNYHGTETEELDKRRSQSKA